MGRLPIPQVYDTTGKLLAAGARVHGAGFMSGAGQSAYGSISGTVQSISPQGIVYVDLGRNVLATVSPSWNQRGRFLIADGGGSAQGYPQWLAVR